MARTVHGSGLHRRDLLAFENLILTKDGKISFLD